MRIGVKGQLADVIAHTEGGKENIARQIQNTARQISETVRNRTHVHINFYLRMTDTMTSQNIDLFSWDILYKEYCENVVFYFLVVYVWQI
jgi:hypothetical protein